MTQRRDYDAEAAVRALGMRLTDWGVAEAGPKARSFIDDMQRQGWKCRNEQSNRKPPQRHEECPSHPGQYRLSCSGCAADKRAVREEADAHREQAAEQTKAEAIVAARAAIKAAQEQAQAQPPTPDQGVPQRAAVPHTDEEETA